MLLAYTMMPGPGDMDRLLSKLAERLFSRGLRVCGCVQSNIERPDLSACDMFIRTLPAQNEYQISQYLGRGAKSCRLDANALEAAVGDVTREFVKGADLLLINKFGKHEAQGRGFRALIGQAVAEGTPTLVGLNELNRPAFLVFAEGLAVRRSASLEDLLDWADTVCPLSRVHRARQTGVEDRKEPAVDAGDQSG
ncbi:MAG: DUF2478 domain-containing protein [Pseudomonadota bacterium]